jgi:hypothetical protein
VAQEFACLLVECGHLRGVITAGSAVCEVGLYVGVGEFANGDLGANVVTVLHNVGLPMVVKNSQRQGEYVFVRNNPVARD